MEECITVSWPLIGGVLALTAPRIVAEVRNGYHSGDKAPETGSEKS